MGGRLPMGVEWPPRSHARTFDRHTSCDSPPTFHHSFHAFDRMMKWRIRQEATRTPSRGTSVVMRGLDGAWSTHGTVESRKGSSRARPGRSKSKTTDGRLRATRGACSVQNGSGAVHTVESRRVISRARLGSLFGERHVARRDNALNNQYRGTSIIRNEAPLGPYSRNMPRVLWWS